MLNKGYVFDQPACCTNRQIVPSRILEEGEIFQAHTDELGQLPHYMSRLQELWTSSEAVWFRSDSSARCQSVVSSIDRQDIETADSPKIQLFKRLAGGKCLKIFQCSSYILRILSSSHLFMLKKVTM